MNDGTGDSNIATVTLEVEVANDAPVAEAISASTNEDTNKSITLVGTDIDGDSLTYTKVTDPAHGTVSFAGSTASYTPESNYSGADSFTYLVNDNTVDSNTATVTINVTAVNDAPTANSTTATTDEDTAKAIILTATDPEGSTLTYTAVTQPSQQSVVG